MAGVSHEDNIILNSVSDGVTVNSGGQFVFANKTFANMIGYDANDLLGMNVLDVTAPDYHEIVAKYTRMRQQGLEVPTQYELELLKKDGEHLPVEFSVSRIDYKGKSSSLTIVRDTSERDAIERELVKRESWFSAFMESASDGFELYDSDLKYIKVNQVILDRLGLSEENVIGKHILAIRPRHENSIEYQNLLKVLKTGDSYSRFISVDSRGQNNLQIKVFKVLDGLGIISNDLSALIKTEESLRQSEENYRTLFQNTGEATFIHLRGSNFVEVNNAAAELLGYTKEELLEMNPNDLSLEDNSEVMSALYEKIVAAGKITRESNFVAKNGSSIDVEVVSNVIQYQGQDAILTVARDISQRKINEVNLRVLHSHTSKMAEANTYKEIYDITHEAITDIIDVDRVALGVIERENIIYRHIANPKTVLPLVLPLHGRSISSRAIKTGTTQNVNNVNLDPDFLSVNPSQDIVKSEIVAPIKHEDTVLAVLNIASNSFDAFSVIDQRLVEILASHIAAAFSRIKYTDRVNTLYGFNLKLGNAESIEVIVETTFRIMNAVLGFKFSSFHLIEDDFLVTIGIDGNSSLGLNFPLDGRGITTKVAREGETVLLHDVRTDPDYIQGSTESLSELAVPIQIEDHTIGVLNVESFQLNAFSVDDARLLETLAQNVGSAIFRLQADENRVKLERELLMERVRTEQEQELNKLKTRFMSTATHEIRTPLSSIQGYIEILRDIVGDLSEEQVQYFNVIQRNVQRLSVLTDDLLDLQRLEEGRLTLHLETVDVNRLLDDVVNEFSPILAEKNQTLRIDREEINMSMDRLRVMQVIVNLLSNASKFSPVGSEIMLDVSQTEDEALFRVNDSGLGLTPDDLDKLFTPFPDILVDGNVSGTGLGLSICKGIVDLHSGDIWAESMGQGQGSSFIFTIPFSFS